MIITEPAAVGHECPVCRSNRATIFVEITEATIHCNSLCGTYEEAINAPRGDIRLAFCESCGHVFNVAFDPDAMHYDPHYDNSLHFSPRFQQYAESLAEELIERHDLRNKQIVEIGCGKGDFLLLLCERGNNRGIGFDPSYVQERSLGSAADRVTFVQDFYSERYADREADCIICRHVLEHVPSPRAFLNSLRNTVGDRLDMLVFFEVPDVMFTLKDLGIWDLIYEHCSYFTSHSLACLFTACGFEVSDLKSGFEGQFLQISAAPAKGSADPEPKHLDPIDQIGHEVEAFEDSYTRKVQTWAERMSLLKKSGKRAVVWGSGSKGVTFLNTIKFCSQIEYAIDINPHKQGKYVPGTGQEIVSPSFLKEIRPDFIIVMNPIYVFEINKITRKMGLYPDFWVV